MTLGQEILLTHFVKIPTNLKRVGGGGVTLGEEYSSRV